MHEFQNKFSKFAKMLRFRSLSKINPLIDNLQVICNGFDKLSLHSRDLSSFARHAALCRSNNNNNKSSNSSSQLWTSTNSLFTSSSDRSEVIGQRCWERSKVSLPGGLVQNVREYRVGEGSIKWRRRKEKEITQRLKVLNPLSPVIDQRVPLPPHNIDKFPPDLFGVPVRDFAKEQEETKGVVAEINRQFESQDYGRLFAVINVKGKQFKVTTEDIIILQGYWAPDIGDRIRLHKILLVGGSDFTLAGRPLLDGDMIRVEGTVIEKTLSYTKLHFRLKKRKNYRRLKFSKDPYTMLRINMIELLKPIAIPESRKQEDDQTIDVNYRVTMNERV